MESVNQNNQEEEHYDVILDDVETGIRPRKLKTDTKKKKVGMGWGAATAIGEIGFDIALPMALGLFVGTKLDEQWGTRPKATLILFGAGLVLGCTSLIRIVRVGLGKR